MSRTGMSDKRSSATSPRGTQVLHVDNISAGYGTHKVLDSVSLSVSEGAFVGLLGHNGAGKTTIMQAITGHIRAKKGSIHYAQQNISKLSTTTIAQSGIAYVPQGHAVFPSLSIRENMNIGAALQNDRSERQKQEEFCFDLFPILKDRLSHKAGSLSGGQRQMLAIAMSLASSPQLMLMDEPSTGLAPVLADEVLQAIKRINTELGTSVVVVEAEIRRIVNLADRITVLKLGSVVFDGLPSDLEAQNLTELF